MQYKSEAGRRALLEHNRRFTQGNALLPPIFEDAEYGSLACSHLNIAFRCIRSGLSSPAGILKDLVNDEGQLRDVVHHGHKWWILPETVRADKQLDISLWRNMDQNENQTTHEIEVLQSIKVTCQTMSKKHAKITQGDLCAAAARRNPAKLSANTLSTLCKFFVGFLENNQLDLVQDLVDFHAHNVDPKELCVSIAFFNQVASEEALAKCPHVRMYLVVSQYCSERVKCQATGPALSQFIESKQISDLCKKPELLESLENKLIELKDKYFPILEAKLGARVAKMELAVLMRVRGAGRHCFPNVGATRMRLSTK